MDFEKLKRTFLQIMIGCLVAFAVVAVVAVLSGGFSDVLGKSLLTILVVASHSLLAFGFAWSEERKKTRDNLEIFTNAIFIILILSFITAPLGIWSVMSGSLVEKLYVTYVILLFAILHGEVLARILNKETYLDVIVYVNYAFMVAVVTMLLMIVFFADGVGFGDAFNRILAACGIIDATLTMVAIILHRLYLQKHPELTSPIFELQQVQPANGQPTTTMVNGQPMLVQQPPKKRGMSILVIILIAYLGLQLFSAVGLFIFSQLIHN